MVTLVHNQQGGVRQFEEGVGQDVQEDLHAVITISTKTEAFSNLVNENQNLVLGDLLRPLLTRPVVHPVSPTEGAHTEAGGGSDGLRLLVHKGEAAHQEDCLLPSDRVRQNKQNTGRNKFTR